MATALCSSGRAMPAGSPPPSSGGWPTPGSGGAWPRAPPDRCGGALRPPPPRRHHVVEGAGPLGEARLVELAPQRSLRLPEAACRRVERHEDVDAVAVDPGVGRLPQEVAHERPREAEVARDRLADVPAIGAVQEGIGEVIGR